MAGHPPPSSAPTNNLAHTGNNQGVLINQGGVQNPFINIPPSNPGVPLSHVIHKLVGNSYNNLVNLSERYASIYERNQIN